MTSPSDREYRKAFYQAVDVQHGADPRQRGYYVPIYDRPEMRPLDLVPQMQDAIDFERPDSSGRCSIQRTHSPDARTCSSFRAPACNDSAVIDDGQDPCGSTVAAGESVTRTTVAPGRSVTDRTTS